MSRWLQHIHVRSSSDRSRDHDRNGSKGKVHPHTLLFGRNSNHHPDFLAHRTSSDDSNASADETLLHLHKALNDREDELSDRSYQLLIQKLQLSEHETMLAQQYEHLTRSRPNSAAAMNQLRSELESLTLEWQAIQVQKAKLVEQHERLEMAIEAIGADKERLAEEWQVQFSVH